MHDDAERRRGTLGGARMMAGLQVRASAWFWGSCAVLVPATLISNAMTIGVDASVAQYVPALGPWFLLAVGILIITRFLTLHVANGLTRRTFVRAALVTGGAAAAVNALLTSAALALEASVFDSRGWPRATDVLEGTDSTLVPFALSLAAGHLSGLLVGAAFYRFGPRGALLLPACLAPVVLVATVVPGTGQWLPQLTDLPAAPAALTGLAVLLAATVASWRLIRTIPVAPPRS